MEKLTKIIILYIFICMNCASILFSQIGNMIPTDVLPDTLADGKLPWQKAGYDCELDNIIIDKIFNVSTDLNSISGNTLDEKITNVYRFKI